MFFREHKRFFKWLTVLAVLGAAGTAGYVLASNEPRVVDVAPEVTDVPAGADDARIEKGALIEWDYGYRMCSHHIYLTCEAGEDTAGLTFTEFRHEHPDVRIVSFEPYRLSLKMSFDCYCPRHFILRKHKDNLAILRTLLGSDEQEVFLEVPIRFDSIEEDKIKVLEAGKLFDSLEELEQYIDVLEIKQSY